MGRGCGDHPYGADAITAGKGANNGGEGGNGDGAHPDHRRDGQLHNLPRGPTSLGIMTLVSMTMVSRQGGFSPFRRHNPFTAPSGGTIPSQPLQPLQPLHSPFRRLNPFPDRRDCQYLWMTHTVEQSSVEQCRALWSSVVWSTVEQSSVEHCGAVWSRRPRRSRSRRGWRAMEHPDKWTLDSQHRWRVVTYIHLCHDLFLCPNEAT